MSNINEILEQIKPTLKDCEKKRKKILVILFFVIIAILGGIYWCLNAMYGDETSFDSAFIFFAGVSAILLLVMFNILISFTNKGFKSYIKEKYINSIINGFNLTRIQEEQDISNVKSEIIRSDLFPSFNDLAIDDHYHGQYKDVPFDIMECDLGIKHEKNYQIVFHGVVISMRSNKNITSDIKIKSKHKIDRNTKVKDVFAKFMLWTVITLIIVSAIVAMYLGTVTEKPSVINFLWFVSHYIMENLLVFLIFGFVLVIKILDKIIKRPKVITEDVVFEKKFDIYSKDQVEARYIVTPAFMERLKSFSVVYGTTGQSWAFYDNKIMIAIPTRDDMFELGDLFHNITNAKDIIIFYEQIMAITEMIEHFKLDEKTGL